MSPRAGAGDTIRRPCEAHGARVCEATHGIQDTTHEVTPYTSAKTLRTVRLEPTQGDIGQPYYRARSRLQVLALLEEDAEKGDSEGSSNALRKWRRRESNPRSHMRYGRHCPRRNRTKSCKCQAYQCVATRCLPCPTAKISNSRAPA